MIVALGMPSGAYAQGYVDQQKVSSILNCQGGRGNSTLPQPVSWHLYHYINNNDTLHKGAWEQLMAHADSLPGVYQGYRRYIIELANRTEGNHFKVGNNILVPDSFPTDYRAYSPYPLHYPVADTIAKLFIIDKYTQTFGAYEHGKLVRWGLVSSGNTNKKTPAGRYNFNWKDSFRISNASPPGERWELPFMVNFHIKWGLHVHQYSLPIGKAVSHGCVRVAMADAYWNYKWANGTIWGNNSIKSNGTPVMVINDNPPANRAYHWLIKDGMVQSLVHLPEDLYTIPTGSYMQTQADWLSGR
ncbi:MAG: L,D-transpeptidase [Chitinophagales bacterium]|nr:L,D-transpeptidase [Chitinophagaceae bacterium]MCB9065673.1 L,D-transpeptidase [Chitinophagales bacterium]